MTEAIPALDDLRQVPRQRQAAAPSSVRLGVVARAEASGGDAPALAGFIASSFSPLVAEAAARCLTAAGRVTIVPGADPPGGDPPSTVGDAEDGARRQDGADARRTGIVILSASGDVATNASIARGVDAGARLGPLLFFQAVPNAVAGYIAARWGLTGPVVCLSPAGDALADGYAAAELLIIDGDADEVLIIVAEQSDLDGERDHAFALLVCDKGVQP